MLPLFQNIRYLVNKYCTGNPSVLFHRTVELGGISLGSTGEGSGSPKDTRPL